MMFRRDPVKPIKYSPPNEHLLEFGSTEFGTVDLVGQPGGQDCWLDSHAGSGIYLGFDQWFSV